MPNFIYNRAKGRYITEDNMKTLRRMFTFVKERRVTIRINDEDGRSYIYHNSVIIYSSRTNHVWICPSGGYTNKYNAGICIKKIVQCIIY